MNNIFTHSEEIRDNIDGSMKNLGLEPQERKPSYEMKTKKGCKMCWGKGILTVHTPKNEIVKQYCKCARIRRIDA